MRTLIEAAALSRSDSEERIYCQINRLKRQNGHYRAAIRLLEPVQISTNGPLRGVTFSIKDNIAVKGRPASLGINPPPIASATATAEIVDFFLGSGAVATFACNMDELAIGAGGHNRYFGQMINPVDAELTPGGSSAGGAIGVALGWSDFSIGSDNGGSVRIPAVCCGVYGLKLSSEAFSSERSYLLPVSLDSLGLMSGSLNDLAFLVSTFSPEPDENFTLAMLHPEDLRFCSKKVLDLFTACISKIGAAWPIRALPESLCLPEMQSVRKHSVASALACQVHELGLSYEQISPEAAALCLLAKQNAGGAPLAPRYLESVTRILGEENCYIVTPVMPFESPHLGAPISGELNIFLTPANVLGVPALSMPLNRAGFGLQIIGKKGSEATLVLIGQLISEKLHY
ncbi:MAG: amidase [Deltaproteobacteria bacterium]|nr:amidase [Deltaproteobacteria bacterium]